MFPFEDVDGDLAWDDYGAALRPGEFQSREEVDPGGWLGASSYCCPNLNEPTQSQSSWCATPFLIWVCLLGNARSNFGFAPVMGPACHVSPHV